MTVVVVTDCPAKLRGDLTKWMIEINTGVYVGNLSARVREELWIRICENLKNGRATMVFRAANEQRMDFWVHNTTWEPVDFDGLKLMCRPSQERLMSQKDQILGENFSNAAKMKRARRMAYRQKKSAEVYTVVDVETSGLNYIQDSIIELAAVRVEDKKPIAEFHTLVNFDKELSNETISLTGITKEELAEKGQPLVNAIGLFLEFIGSTPIVCHNAAFDQQFLQAACRKCNLPFLRNRFIDTLPIARRKVTGVCDYKLTTLADYFSLDTSAAHRALVDCYLVYEIYNKIDEL